VNNVHSIYCSSIIYR